MLERVLHSASKQLSFIELLGSRSLMLPQAKYIVGKSVHATSRNCLKQIEPETEEEYRDIIVVLQ